jgi:queuosine precursor transporter
VKLDARLNLFITLVAIFVTCLIVGDMIGGKLTSFELFGREWVFSVGQLAFPVTFILTDILNEFYGRKVVRRITFLAFFMVALTFSLIYLASAMPWAPFTLEPGWTGVGPSEFEVVFTQATAIQVASMIAFLIGNLTDISVFFLIKKATGNRMLWLRATGSTAVSQLIDTIVISGIIWFGISVRLGWPPVIVAPKVTFEQFVTIVLTSYLLKLIAAIVVTPIIYALHELIEKKYGIPPAPAEVDSADIAGLPEAKARSKSE